MDSLIAYDLDGTICDSFTYPKSFFKCNKDERLEYTKLKEDHYKNAKLIRTVKDTNFIIITSRRRKYKEITLNWLKENNVRPHEVFFMDVKRTRKTIINYKSFHINQLRVSRYYEDDPKIAKALIKLCPNSEIILVKKS